MRIVLTLRAESDIETIAAYIFAHNPQRARRVEAELQAALQLIAAYPFVGRETSRSVRRFALPRYPYLIFYGVSEVADEVLLFTVSHGARRVET